jgi:hypothetical protein
MSGLGLAFFKTMPYGKLVNGHAGEQRGVPRSGSK